ncbi:MAG TPA: hypothetical protein PLU87_00070 [Sedimentisphaerales bacterium]|nr:hypothetical protein [Sedimentisphaerales bacterium]HRS13095.1 hypothetical protein [Sedimentisphaerales bacterium]HRV46409.1 hypothetical protein [Sedimentisphaerales bacterium]
MPRDEWKNLDGQRMRFRAIFERYGQKSAYRGAPLKTLLFREVCPVDGGVRVTDHLWFTETKGFRALGVLHQGDCVEFDARVTTYRKGYYGRREDVYKPSGQDWRLSFPTRIRRNPALDRPVPEPPSKPHEDAAASRSQPDQRPGAFPRAELLIPPAWREAASRCVGIGALRVFGWLCEWTDGGRQPCEAPIMRLARLCAPPEQGMLRTKAIKRHLRKLSEAGMISRVRRQGGKRPQWYVRPPEMWNQAGDAADESQ